MSPVNIRGRSYRTVWERLGVAHGKDGAEPVGITSIDTAVVATAPLLVVKASVTFADGRTFSGLAEAKLDAPATTADGTNPVGAPRRAPWAGRWPSPATTAPTTGSPGPRRSGAPSPASSRRPGVRARGAPRARAPGTAPPGRPAAGAVGRASRPRHRGAHPRPTTTPSPATSPRVARHTLPSRTVARRRASHKPSRPPRRSSKPSASCPASWARPST